MDSSLLPFSRGRSTWLVITAIFALSAVLLSLVLFLHFTQGIPIGDMVRDPTAVAGVSIYVGFLSQFGIFFWAGAATLCLFSMLILPRTPANTEARRFLMLSGLLSLTLGFDDVFLLHEAFFPHIGIPELAVFAAYGVFVAYYLVRFHKTILRTEYVLLVIALGFFAVSVLFDLLDPPGLDPDFWEDVAKVVGIVAWATYFLRTCHEMVGHKASLKSPSVAPEGATHQFAGRVPAASLKR